MYGSPYLNHLDMNTRFKVFASYNILQYVFDFYPCSYIRNCLKMPKKSQINEYSDHFMLFKFVRFNLQNFLVGSNRKTIPALKYICETLPSSHFMAKASKRSSRGKVKLLLTSVPPIHPSIPTHVQLD